MELIFVETAEPPQGAYEAALAALRRFTTSSVGSPDNREFAILVQQSDTGETLGGLWAQSRWVGFYVDMLVVPEESRGLGIGTRLMRCGRGRGTAARLRPYVARYLCVSGAPVL